METYNATYKDKKYCVIVELDLSKSDLSLRNSDIEEITWNVLVKIDRCFKPLKEVEGLYSMEGPDQVDVQGFFHKERKELQIENIQKGFIDDGQNFLLKSLHSLLICIQDVHSIYLANIIHHKTLCKLQEFYRIGSPLDHWTHSERKPLLAALDSCGYTQQSIVLEGTACYGIRALRKKALTKESTGRKIRLC